MRRCTFCEMELHPMADQCPQCLTNQRAPRTEQQTKTMLRNGALKGGAAAMVMIFVAAFVWMATGKSSIPRVQKAAEQRRQRDGLRAEQWYHKAVEESRERR